MRTRILLLCLCIVSYLYSVAQPTNNPCGAAELISSLNGSCDMGNTVDLATEDIGPSACSVGANENVWFYFVANGVSAEVIVTPLGGMGTPEITIIYFPTSSCNAGDAQEIQCVTGTTLVTDNELIVGQTYYIMVAASSSPVGTFNICVDNPTPASNDACITATVINNVDNNCFTSSNIFPSTDVLIPGCFTGSTYNVWFSFIADGVSLDLYVPNGPGVAQVAVIDFVTNCSSVGAVSLGCATGVNHIILDNELVIGSQYFIVVGFQNSDFNGNGIGNFELCIDNPEPAPNDDCDMSIVIPTNVLNDPTTCFNSIAGNPLNNDWPSTDVGLFGCWNLDDSYNIWYSFVAQGPDVQITVDPSFPQDAQIALVEFTGAPCQLAGAVLLECANGAVLDYNDELVIGQTYYFAVGFENNGVGSFCMNVFNPEPPPNDEPCDAIALPTNGNCTDGTTIYANPEGYFVPNACQGAVSNTVWYTLTLSDPDNVGFEIDLTLDDVGPGAEVSIILWEVTDCNQPGNIVFFECGAPPTETIEWGPIDETLTYYLSVTTSEPNETDFQICVDEVPPCFMNDLCTEAELIPNVLSDMAFVCVPGCNLFADPELFNNGCEIGTFSTVWFQVNTDGLASLMNIQVQSQDFTAPTITLFHQITDCTDLEIVPLTGSNLPCVVGSNNEAEAFGSDVGANAIYFIAISSFNSVGGEFELCVNTISSASNCVTSRDIEITSRSSGGPLEGPFFPGETVGVCMNVNSYTAANNGCQWFQGLIPVFGNGWDPSSFDGNGQPMNATVNGNAIGMAGNGLYGSTIWDWFTDVDYHYDHFNYQLGDLDGNGTIDMCNLLFDPDCPNLGGLMGGCCNPCWGAPLGTILPGGWFAYGINGSCPTPGPPVRVDWGDGNTCGGGMGPWAFCFELNVRPYPECLTDPSTQNLMLGFFTTADGETGAWTGNASICALDQPAFVTLPMCCSELEEAEEMLDPICSQQQFVYAIDEPGVEYWEWTVDQGIVTGGLPGSGGPGTVIINTLINGGSDSEIVTYTFLGFAGGACPVFQKEVTIEVFPAIQVMLDPLTLCATPLTPYIITPEVTGGNGVYYYQWSPGGESTPSITVPNPVNGTNYIVSVTDDVGCFGTAQMAIIVYSTFPVDIIAPITEQCLVDGPLSLEAIASGGFEPYSYEWTFPSTNMSTNQAITTDETGEHLVVVTDVEGCIGKDSIDMTFNESPEVYIDAVNGALAICEGESTELAGVATGGESPYIYEWDTPEGPESGKNIFAFTPGTFTITVEDANGCTNTAEIEILAQPEPMPYLGPDQLVCNFDNAVEIEVTEPFDDYHWSVGNFADGMQSIEVYNAGTYTVTVTNEVGCTGEVSVDIDLYPQPVFIMPDTFEFCPGSSVTINADDYGGPWENFLWGQCGGCVDEFTTATPGIYDVYVYDVNGCSGYQEFEVVENSSISPGLQGDSIMCTGETITLSAQAGFVSYVWSANTGGATTQTVDVTVLGNYSVTVVDAEGCIGADTMTIVSGDIVAAISGPIAICANVLATITATPANASYLWSTGQTIQVIQVDDGTHTVTVTSSDGCTSVASITIIETPFVPQITGDNLICQTSESSTLDAGGPYASYLWSANAGSAVTQSVIVSAAGLYTVAVVDASGCMGNAAFTVDNHPVPFVAIAGNPDFCVGGSTQMTATAGFTNYVWNTTALTPTITINTAGPYTVTITDSNGCTNTAVTTVNTPYQETVDITGSFVFCPGDQATLAVPSGYASVFWSTMETTDQIFVSTEGPISVTVIDPTGCIAYDTVITDANSTLSPVITGDPSICDNGNAILDAGPGFDNYQWSNGLGTNQTAIVNAPGNYTVTVSSNAGCVGTDDFDVAQFFSPTATVTANATACDVQEPGGPSTLVNFNSLVTGGDTGGTWAQVSGPSTVNLANAANVNFNGLNSGTYTFSYTTNSAVAPCTEQTYPLTIQVADCSCPPVVLNNAPDMCNDLGVINLNTLVLPQTPSGGSWSIVSTPPGSNPATLTPPDRFDATTADAGTYTLQYLVSGLATYCDDDAMLNINVIRTPVAGIASAAVDYCAGENEVVNLATLITGEDADGLWNESSQNPSTGGAFNAATGTFNVVAQTPGTYTFDYIIMGAGPCPDDMTTVTVVIEANPAADAGSTAELNCITPTAAIGGSNTSVGAAFVYTWVASGGGVIVPPADQPTAIVSSAGTYTLTVVNNLTGCSATDQVVITQIGTFPTDLILLVQSPDCEGDPPGSAQVSAVTGGTAPYSYSLDGAAGVASPVFNNIPAGDHTIEVTDATGCKLSESFSIEELVVTDLEIVDYVNGEFVFDLGDTITLSYAYTGTNNVPDSSVWKLGDSILCTNCTVLQLEAYLAGTITLETYDERGCYNEDAISFLVVRKRDVYIPNVFSPNGDGFNDFFTLFTDSDVQKITLMEIYTRWGDLVFRKTDIDPNVPGQGWDGKFAGENLNPGVYVYRIEIVYGDGLEDQLAGDITIVR
ncbi:MAG: gliding motility-associated C-terminal domain-containing protein [Saprospiraceae bacterium]|nr:gliding motility-associated C-terminal domain-containing protein [Saprospiraceae bacterium]